MGQIFGGGGGGSSKTTGSSEYPAEFKPLAASSAKQIQAAQDALPLSLFTSPQPQQVAGLSPFTLAGMELVPYTAQTSQAEQALMNLQPFWQDISNRALGMTAPSQATQSSTDFLLGTLGIGQGVGPTSGQGFSPMQTGTSLSPGASAPFQFTPPSLGGSAFGPGAPIPTPALTGGGSEIPVTPLMPTAPIAPPAAAAPGGGGGGLQNMQFAANPYGPPGSIVPLTGQMVQSPWGGPEMDRALLEAYNAADLANQQRQNM